MPNFKRHLKQLFSRRRKPEMSFTVSMKMVTTSPFDLYKQEGSSAKTADQRWSEIDTDGLVCSSTAKTNFKMIFMSKEKAVKDV